MFGALKDLSIPAVVEPPAKSVMKRGMSLRAFRAAHRQLAITSKITESLAKSKGIVTDFSDLRRLKNVVQTQGINRTLMLFANPGDNVISKIVKNIPSNESLDAVSIGKSDRRTKAALEGMTESLAAEPKLISDWTHASADDVIELLSSVEDQMEDLGEAVSHYLQTLEESDPASEDLTVSVEASQYDTSLARIDALLEILPDMDALVSDPCDRDAMEVYKEKISALVEKIGSVAGLAVDPENKHLIVAAPVSDDVMSKEGTLAELGYNTTNTIELLKKADQLIDEVNGLIQRKEQMGTHLHDTADVISQIDNTVPPAVDGAINDDDESDVTLPDGGLTQADIYHCQVASHLYSLSVIVSASVCAVQEVLLAADALSGNEETFTVVVVDQPTE